MSVSVYMPVVNSAIGCFKFSSGRVSSNKHLILSGLMWYARFSIWNNLGQRFTLQRSVYVCMYMCAKYKCVPTHSLYMPHAIKIQFTNNYDVLT